MFLACQAVMLLLEGPKHKGRKPDEGWIVNGSRVYICEEPKDCRIRIAIQFHGKPPTQGSGTALTCSSTTSNTHTDRPSRRNML